MDCLVRTRFVLNNFSGIGFGGPRTPRTPLGYAPAKMIIYDILLILQYQLSTTVMDLVVVLCTVSCLYLCFAVFLYRYRIFGEERFIKCLGPPESTSHTAWRSIGSAILHSSRPCPVATHSKRRRCLRISAISYVRNADSGRCADTLVSHTA